MAIKKLLVAASIVTVSLAAFTVVVSKENTMDFVAAASGDKEFYFNQSVASQVQYGGNETNVVRNVTTGISTPIATKLYREAGTYGEDVSNDGCFFSFEHCNRRTFTFEAGLNNLTGFEIQFKYSYDPIWDSGERTYFKYNVTMTFYHGGETVDTANYSLSQTTRDTVYTHTWTKGIEVNNKIDYVKCSLNNAGGSSRDDGITLIINYYKVVWNC